MLQDEIDMHHAFARYCGIDASCERNGKPKVKYNTEETAMKAADFLNESFARDKSDKTVEPYPCPFCNLWHIGRTMSERERSIWSDPLMVARIPPKITEWEDSHGLHHHGLSMCEGRNCVIHNPSDHHMREWVISWDFSDYPVRAMRICEHGVHHVDPDHIGWLKTWMAPEIIEKNTCEGIDRYRYPREDILRMNDEGFGFLMMGMESVMCDGCCKEDKGEDKKTGGEG